MTPDGYRAAFAADLDMVITNLRSLHARLLADCQENGSSWDRATEAKWEGAFLMVLGVLRDELEPMRDAWSTGLHYSRAGEEMTERWKAEHDGQADRYAREAW